MARNDGSQSRVIGHGQNPLISPDGKRIAFFQRASGGHNQLRVVPVDGGRARVLAQYADSPFFPNVYRPFSWSPNSRYIATADTNSGDGIIIDLRTDRRRHVPPAGLEMVGTSFSPDSRLVAIEDAYQHGPSSLRQVDIRTGTARALTSGVSPGLLAVWG